MVRILLHEDGLNGHIAGDIVEMNEAEAAFWLARDRGEVVEPEPEPVIETAEAAPAPENAAVRTRKTAARVAKPRTRKPK